MLGDYGVTWLEEALRPDDVEELLRVDVPAWIAELPDIEAHFKTFGDRLPAELRSQLAALKARLEKAR